jgi:tRNA (uracil-5-)-methyltransferase TRM9
VGLTEDLTAQEYEFYFASGNYDRRYPRPNSNVLRIARGLLPRGGHLIDFGCGSGRYLMALRHRAGVAAGYDVSATALDLLRAKLARSGNGSVSILGPDPAALDAHVAEHGRADVVLCLFGVLSHIEGRAARRETLGRIARLLDPARGRLVISVPNRLRRFRREQRALMADEIRYSRRFGARAIELPYKLFDPESFRAELREAGFAIERLVAESVVAEAGVARSPVLRTLDRLACPLLPAAWGYGLLAVARPVAGTLTQAPPDREREDRA